MPRRIAGVVAAASPADIGAGSGERVASLDGGSAAKAPILRHGSSARQLGARPLILLQVGQQAHHAARGAPPCRQSQILAGGAWAEVIRYLQRASSRSTPSCCWAPARSTRLNRGDAARWRRRRRAQRRGRSADSASGRTCWRGLTGSSRSTRVPRMRPRRWAVPQVVLFGKASDLVCTARGAQRAPT